VLRASVVGSVIALAAIVVGCGSSRPTTAPRAVTDDIASVVFSSPQEDRQARTLAAAREHLVARCMAARGFTYRFTALAPSIPVADAPPSGTGYGLFAQFAKAAAASPRAAPRGSAYRRALVGSPRDVGTLLLPGGVTVRYRAGGCYAHALGALYGSARRHQWLVARRNAVRNAAGERVASDPRLAGALAGWRRCMAARRFPYPSPDAARQDVYEAYQKASDPTRVGRRELATAAADRDCAQRSALYPALARARHDALRTMSSAERAAAATLARSRATALERARRSAGADGDGVS
jgi:hypothetical protein